MLKQTTRQLSGVVGFFPTPDQLIEATRKVRDARYPHFDAFTPYPVHGLEHAQGLKRSPLPYVTLGAGLTGACLGFLLQYWTSAVSWPLNVGGKPLNSWPAFVPVMFELTVLLAGLATVGAMFILNGMPNIKRKAFDPGITRDRFALMIEAPPVLGGGIFQGNSEEESGLRTAAMLEKHKVAGFKSFSEQEATDFLMQAGAVEVRSIYSEGWF